MSIEQLLEIQQVLEREPLAFILVANSVWGRNEDAELVALFDTLEQAQAYEKACRLPEPIVQLIYRRVDTLTEIGVERHDYPMSRSYRPDSLLWDFNPPFDHGQGPTCGIYVPTFSRAPVGFDYAGCPKNPEPPSGPIVWPEDMRFKEGYEEKVRAWEL